MGRKRNSKSPSPYAPRNLAAVKALFIRYQANARLKKRAWSLSLLQFEALVTGDCVYCGAPPQNKGSSLVRNFAFAYQGIDRVVNSQGYTPENSVSCCAKCNAIKSDILTAEEMLLAMRAIKKFRK